MRKLQWTYGRAWLAPQVGELPPIDVSPGDVAIPLDRMHTFSLPASAAAGPGAVAVELRFQTGSPSFHASLRGQLAPGSDGRLSVMLWLPSDSARASNVVASIVAGIESLPVRPAGKLSLWCPFVHPVDLKAWAWERCAATLLRLMMSDAAGMSDDDAARVARELLDRRLTDPSTPEPRVAVSPALFVADDVAAVVASAAARIREVAMSALLSEDRFRIALAGGSTPRALYPKLVDAVDWSRADVFFGDERVVPADDPQSNYRMARETLLAPARVPEANIFRWRTESADLDAAARAYEQALRARPVPPQLDLALLGLGADGHTASLFPGTTALAVEDRLAVAVDVPTLNARRLTLTYPPLLEAGEVFFLVTGRDKSAALAEIVRPGSTLPAARIAQRPRSACIFCDRDAAHEIISAAPI